MEANATTISIISIMKWLFPSLIGSSLAVWYKRHDVEWKNKDTLEKFLISLVAIGAIIIGCIIGFAIGNSIIAYLLITEFWYQFLLYIICGLSSLKVLDAVVKNSDEVISMITDGFKKGVKKFIDKIFGG